MIKKIAAAAILMCAVMVLVAGAPAVTADTHHIVRGAQGVPQSTVRWIYTPAETGIWTGHIVNSGLKWIVVNVTDITTGAESWILQQRFRFGAYPSNTLDTDSVIMAKNHKYQIAVTPSGPKGTSCTVEDMFTTGNPPVAMFTYAVNGPTVNVDGSSSYDPNGIPLTAWGWEWGDGSASSVGETASHTYSASGIYTITLTVLANSGMTGSTNQDVPITVADTSPVASFAFATTGLTVNVDASASTDDVGIVSYAWDFGDLTTGTGKLATHTYAASGTYSITLTVTDTIGQTGMLTKDVSVVDNPPVASFTYTTAVLTVNVDASASTDDVGIASYAWDFGDLTTGTGKLATHTYAARGTYSVTLTVTDTIGQTGMLTKSVSFVDNPPVASFTYTTAVLTVNVDASGSTDDVGIVSYAWNFGDLTTGTGKLATHTYAASGTYSITLTVTDTIGQTGVSTKAVAVADKPPVASFTYTTTGLTVSVDASGSSDDVGIVSYAWDFGDLTTGTGKLATHTYAVPGTYSVTLTVTDTIGQTGILTKSVSFVDNPPVASFTTAVSGYSVTVTSTSTDDHGIASYSWNWGDGSAAGTGTTATHTYTGITSVAALTKTIVLTVTDTVGQTNSASKTVTLQDNAPVASFTATVSGYSVTVTSTSTDDHGIASYSWNWGDGSAAGTGATATHTYTGITSVAALTKTIVLTVTDTVGQTNSASKTVTLVDNPPVAAFTPTTNLLIVSVDASASTDDHGIASYAWNFGDSTTGTGVTASHTYAATGTYTIALTVTDTIGQTNSVSHPVTMGGNPPVASFTATVSGYTVSVDASASTSAVGIASYAWNWGDSTTGTGVTASHTYTAVPPLTKTITLTVTDTIGQTGLASKTVTLQDNPPVASFTATPSGYSVTVTSTSTDDHGIASYSWNWGDGSAAGTGASATHTYTAVPPLTQTIILTVTDTVGQTNSATKTVTLQDNAPVASFTATVTGYSVTVTSTSTDDHGIASYSWNWGDGSAAGTGATATHTYTGITSVAALTKTIVLTVTDTVGQTNSASKPVTLQDNLPAASFTTAVTGYSVTVTSTSTDDHGIASYSWNWGDGSAAGTGASATHTYTAVPPLTQTIILTVTDTVGQTNSATKTVTLQDNPPVAAFTATPSGYSVTVTSTSTDDHGIASYSWNWGDGSAAGTGATATHAYTGITSVAALTKTIVLTVTDTVGQTNSLSKPVTLQDNPPVAAFTATPSGYSVTVTSTSTDDHGIASYSWNWGDGSAAGTGASATHTYTAVPPLIRTIALTVTDTVGQTNTASQSVTLQDNPPVAAFTATPSGYSVTVTSTSTDDHGIASYSWNWGDGSAAGTGATATHTYTAVPPLARTIILTVTDTVGQTNSLSKSVTLQDNPPVASFTSVVSGYSVTVTSTSTDDHGIASYSWNWGDGSAAGTGATATHTYTGITSVAALTKTIVLTVTDTVGQTNSASNPVTLQDNPPAASFTTAVTGYSVTVTSTSTDDHGIASYSWNWGDGSAAGTGATATHTYTAVPPLTQTIILTVTDTVGQTNSATKTVTLQDNPPVAAFTATPSGYSVTVTSTSTDDHGIASYSWNWGDGSAAGTGATATHTYTGITSVAALTKTIVLTVTDTVGQTNSATKTVTLQDNAPVAAFTIAPPTGLAVSVDASASTDDHGIASYAWNFGDSTTGTGVTATHTYAGSGTYTITLTVTDTVGQTNLVTHPVTVSQGSPPPVASFTVTVSGATASVDGSASTSSAGIASYSWDWGDSITGPSAVTASHVYLSSGTYTITLTVTDTLGQKGTLSKTATVVNSGIPPPPFLIYGATWASDGVTPLVGCTVTITDVRTGTTLIGVVSDETGSYFGDISPLYPVVGDTIIVKAIGPAGQTGSGTGVVGTSPYLGIDVTLSG